MANPTKLTPEQVWYVSKVYPERVTPAEAKDAYDKAIAGGSADIDMSYWQACANVFNDLVLRPANPDEKRFFLSFSMESDAFQKRQTTNEVMKILGKVSGNYATGRMSGQIMDSSGKPVGEFLTLWRHDPEPEEPPEFPRKR